MRARPYLRRGRETWIVRVFADDGHTVAKQVTIGPASDPTSEARAEAFAERFNTREERRGAIRNFDPTKPILWEQVLDDYLEAYVPQLSKGSRRTVRNRVAHLRRALEGDDLRDLTARDVQLLAKQLRELHALTCRCADCDPAAEGAESPLFIGAESAIGALSTFRRVVRLYGREHVAPEALSEFRELLAQIRRAGVRAGEGVDPRDAWTPQEVECLLSTARDYEPLLYPPLLCALHTGARRGEILALRWSRVELDGGRIHFRNQLTDGEEKAVKWGKPHSAPVSPDLDEVLRRLLRDAGGRKVLRLHETGSPFVFRSPMGLRWHEGNFTKRWLRVRERARKQGVRPFPWHSSRHTFVTWALESGKSVPWVASVVGASKEIILRNYAHAIRSDDEDISFLSRKTLPNREDHLAARGRARARRASASPTP